MYYTCAGVYYQPFYLRTAMVYRVVMLSASGDANMRGQQ
jgi:hypothetical protein